MLKVSQCVTYHTFHEANKAPKGNGVVLHDCVDRRKQVAHALNVTKVLIVLIVSEKHVLHLLKMNVGADIRKRRIGIGMWNVLASEDGDIAICAMYVFFYTTDPIEWDKSAKPQ
jgi:hypothetical protein